MIPSFNVASAQGSSESDTGPGEELEFIFKNMKAQSLSAIAATLTRNIHKQKLPSTGCE